MTAEFCSWPPDLNQAPRHTKSSISLSSHGVAFRLVVDLRQVQSIVSAKLVNEPIIVKVWEHRQPSQRSLI